MSKFEAKKKDFAKIWQKLGAIALAPPPPPGCAAYDNDHTPATIRILHATFSVHGNSLQLTYLTKPANVALQQAFY